MRGAVLSYRFEWQSNSEGQIRVHNARLTGPRWYTVGSTWGSGDDGSAQGQQGQSQGSGPRCSGYPWSSASCNCEWLDVLPLDEHA